MTDNEIIKNFEKLTKYSGFTKKVEKLLHDVIDLINRQKAENESLKADLAKCSIRLDNLYKTADEIKSEAVREFAERFAKELSEFDMSSVGLPDYDRGYEDCMTAIEYTIDTLVKEMTEVTE